MQQKTEIYKLALLGQSIIKNHSPFRTGNLRYNAIRISNKQETEAVIYVDQNIAPYMPFTNEPWTSPKWGGRRNPNEGWWDSASNKAIQTIAQMLGATARRIK